MSRSNTFKSNQDPLGDNNDLQLDNNKVRGPFAFLNPTQAHYDHVPAAKPSGASETSEEADQTTAPAAEAGAAASGIGYRWRSRDNRKGRYALVVKLSEQGEGGQYALPPRTNSFNEVMKGIGRMFTYYPIWDVSYLVAFTFTWGSVIWVLNAFFAFLPFTNPKSEFNGEVLYGGGITAFIGATVFEIGSVLLMLEAVNENRTGCFGWALEQAWDEEVSGHRVRPEKDACTHHHGNKKNLVGKPANPDAVKANEKNSAVDGPTETTAPATNPNTKRSWNWWPSWYDLRTHYLHSIGFLASLTQMLAATVFWISGFTALPGIYNNLAPLRVLNGVYWVPQIIGGAGFVISGWLFMTETQSHWWLPAPKVLGWHIGFWNLVGGIGFTLCPIFGLGSSHWRGYQASCATFWGSWAFLIGSLIQWYEALDKHPVEHVKEN